MAKSAPRNTYSTYLKIEELLAAQDPQTNSDDELLFIIIHQSQELWFKLAIHELTCAVKTLMPRRSKEQRIDKRDCVIAYKRLARVSQIQELLIETWGVLRTLTPDEFHVFRASVGRDGASGFQSAQYRVLEFKLGLRYDAMATEIIHNGQPTPDKVSIYKHATPEEKKSLRDALESPSIYDAVVAFMERSNPAYDFGDDRHNDYSQRYKKKRAVFNAWKNVYEHRDTEAELYQVGEKLIDLEDAFRRWRFNHLATVSRIIGSNAGTGGSTGLRYLQRVANQLFDEPMYPELWDVRNYMFSKDDFDLSRAGYPSE